LPPTAPELVLSQMLKDYGNAIRARTANMPSKDASYVRLTFIGLQQRLLSSIAAFAKTLEVHRKGMLRADIVNLSGAQAFVSSDYDVDEHHSESDHVEKQMCDAEDLYAESAGAIAVAYVDVSFVDQMLEVAKRHAHQPDARVLKLVDWIRENLICEGQWNERKLIESLDDFDPENCIASFTGSTSTERREELKRRFNSDPKSDKLRILICTDAAREGINLQMRCYDLIHVDLPWNPARLEQRNGRIDRKLQPAKQVWCRYFLYEQREEDVVLQALVKKTERIREQLGSAGQVIGYRLSDRLTREGIWRPAALAKEIEETDDSEGHSVSVEEMDDETTSRRARQAKELDSLRNNLERSREKVGVDADELRSVVGKAMQRAGTSLDSCLREEINGTAVYNLDPTNSVFSSGGWPAALDDLRVRRRRRSEKLKDWRAEAPLRAVSFKPAITKDKVDAEGVLQLHLEHRLVRRLLSRFLSQGFSNGLSRASVVVGPGAQPRVVLMGRLALYGPGAARLHEEIILVTAPWNESGRGKTPLKPFGVSGEEATLDQLSQAFKNPREPASAIVQRVRQWASSDATDLERELRRRAELNKADATKDLLKIGEDEAKSLKKLLEEQRGRVAKADAEPDDKQLSFFPDNEADQRRRDRRHWKAKLEKLTTDIAIEPERVRKSYEVVADRLETIGLVYLWPEGN